MPLRSCHTLPRLALSPPGISPAPWRAVRPPKTGSLFHPGLPPRCPVTTLIPTIADLLYTAALTQPPAAVRNSFFLAPSRRTFARINWAVDTSGQHSAWSFCSHLVFFRSFP